MAQRNDKFGEVGASGLKHWGGVLEEEFLRELRGLNGAKVYREMSKNEAVISASLFAYTTLAKEVLFEIESADPENNQADEIADFVRTALFDDMSISWHDLLGEILSFLTYGWSYFEVVYKRRGGDATTDPGLNSRYTDNKIGWRKWAIRGQDTLENWIIDDAGGLQGMVQRAAPKYERVEIPISKALLFRTIMERNAPEGVSILRGAYTPFYHKRRLQIIRGIGVERDLAGMPVITPPEGLDIWNPQDSNAVLMKAAAERIVRNIRRDEHEGVIKPFGWTLELLSSGGSRQFDITAVIKQLNAEMAMSLMTDFLLVGHEGTGSFSLAVDKRGVFSHAAASFLDNICEVVNRFAIPELLRLNGMHTDLSPKLTHGPVAEIDLTTLSTFIKDMAGVGLIFPDEALEQHIRTRALLPPAPEDRVYAEPDEKKLKPEPEYDV